MITNTSPLPNGVAGTPYNLPLNATGGFPPYTWSVITGTLPTGFVVSGSVISGTSLTTGSSIFTLMVKDLDGASSSQQFSIFITPAANPFMITTSSPLPVGQVGTQYAQTLDATGAPQPYTWSVVSGALPNGLTLNRSTLRCWW